MLESLFIFIEKTEKSRKKSLLTGEKIRKIKKKSKKFASGKAL
jgi:hypothetical protein